MAVIHRKKYSARGFTLIEMLTVTGIIVLISGLVLFNNARFGGQVLLQNLAYDIALSIRQAQVYGISVARFNNTYAPAYGMHFDVRTPTAYILFGDTRTPQNGLYDGSDEFIQSTSIQSGYRIASLCAVPPSGSTCDPVTTLDISFRRPEPDAYIHADVFSGTSESAHVRITSPRGFTKDITVGVNGQIAVE